MKNKLNCVLLVDDDEPTNFLNQMLVEETGCAQHIQVAQGGEIALDYLTNSEDATMNDDNFPCPDLIFLDINMPVMNGWEFLEKYRQLKIKHKVKVVLVMLTTSLFPEDKLRAEAIPEISGFENKPLTPEAWERIMQKYFPDKVENSQSA
ncbi:MAG: response regulator receiver protein [Ferruginibacter sp.]|uniref:response regulator n=1 Tax=Ferruginibacter sp. TaxID=1940288 RepID=UPI0026583E83|nr:response regulator [Ferruginibacter sp.]MDB5280213.1 response regulator receiver protein [Ferruginibacter sp.]